MATSLGIIILLGLLAKAVFEKIKLPGLLGMLILGIILGPYVLNIIDKSMLNVSEDFRLIALLVILLRAGLGISKKQLKSVGKSAIKMSCIPGIIEGTTILLISIPLLGFSAIQGGILGFIIAAVSPAVVVPLMLEFNQNHVGTNKHIPTLILAGASVDDVFAITIFSAFLGLYGGSQVNIATTILSIPLSIFLGIGIGILAALILLIIFKRFNMVDAKKVLIVLSFAIILKEIEEISGNYVAIASLLGVMTLGFVLREKQPKLADGLAKGFNAIWVLAEILLFVLVGAEVNIHVAADAGLVGIGIICIGLIGRSIGVLISTQGSNLNFKERLFCVIAYTPKATVQAAIGAVPLTMGVESGDIILAIAVLSILFTAPLGAIAIKTSSKKLLTIGE